MTAAAALLNGDVPVDEELHVMLVLLEQDLDGEVVLSDEVLARHVGKRVAVKARDPVPGTFDHAVVGLLD